MMPKRLAGLAFIAVVSLVGCAGQGQLSDGGFVQPFQPFQPAPPPPPPPQPYVAPAPTRPYIYPTRGQTPQQEEFDKGQCYSWAVQQTGFDPANPQVAMPPPPPMYSGQPPAPQGGMLRGAMGGAALGAVGGAIGGNAGEGAAIGAGVGALFGLMRRAQSMEQQQQQQQQQAQMQQSYADRQQATMAQGRSNYNRAFSACMSARDYTVQ